MLFPSVAMVAPAPPSSMQLFVTAHPEYSEYLSVNVPLAYDGVTDDIPWEEYEMAVAFVPESSLLKVTSPDVFNRSMT